MANTNSDLVANKFASPVVKSPVGQSGGRLRVMGGNVELTAADLDADGDTVRLAILPQDARVWGIYIGGDHLDTGTDVEWNIGLYEPGTASTGPGSLVGAANAETIFASAIVMQNSAVRDLGSANLVTEGLATSAAAWLKFGHQLYDLAADTRGDFLEYEIVLTATTAASSAVTGTLAFMIFYTID